MHQLKLDWVAERLDKKLGDPLNPDNVMPFKRVVDIDETKEFSCSEIQRLYNWKLQHYYVLAECGGDFTPFKKFLLFVHVLFCQNQTTGVSFT